MDMTVHTAFSTCFMVALPAQSKTRVSEDQSLAYQNLGQGSEPTNIESRLELPARSSTWASNDEKRLVLASPKGY